MADTIIAQITGTATNALLVTTGTFKGQPLVSVRHHYRDSEADEWKPTKKGASFKPEHVPAVIAALQQALDEGGAS